MESGNSKAIMRALLSAVAFFVIMLIIRYVRDVVIGGGAFSPNWVEIILLTVLMALLMYFGPDAAQRKRNRQNLKDSFTRKR